MKDIVPIILKQQDGNFKIKCTEDYIFSLHRKNFVLSVRQSLLVNMVDKSPMFSRGTDIICSLHYRTVPSTV